VIDGSAGSSRTTNLFKSERRAARDAHGVTTQTMDFRRSVDGADIDLHETDFARHTRRAPVDLGGRFMTSAEMLEAGDRLGLPGPVLYFRGRTGVCGDLGADAAAALLAIFPHRVIRHVWENTEAVAGATAATAYAGACAAWGRNNLKIAADDLERAAGLVERVIDAADVAGFGLVAGWRGWPRPNDPPGRAAHAFAVLRELRGALHLAAVHVEGIEIALAVLADPSGGPERLRRLAWDEPAIEAAQGRAAERADLPARWRRAEDTTDIAFGRCAGVLSVTERAELGSLIGRAEAVSRPYADR